MCFSFSQKTQEAAIFLQPFHRLITTLKQYVSLESFQEIK